MKTNALRIALFLIGLALNSIQSSAQLYTTEIQKVRELVAVAQRVPGLEREIQSLDSVVTRMTKIISADSIIKRTKDQRIEVISLEKASYKGLYEAQLVLTRLENKEKRKWRRRTVACVILGVGLLVILN
jgi:hypothetical protein